MGEYGPQLTRAMFARGELPPDEVEVFAARADAVVSRPGVRVITHRTTRRCCTPQGVAAVGRRGGETVYVGDRAKELYGAAPSARNRSKDDAGGGEYPVADRVDQRAGEQQSLGTGPPAETAVARALVLNLYHCRAAEECGGPGYLEVAAELPESPLDG